MKNINEELYELISQYKFSELDSEQKNLVLKNISENEYDQIRSNSADLESCFNERIIAPPISENLLYQTKKNKISIINWKIKIPYVAASILLAFTSGYFSSNLKNQEDNKESIKIVDNQSWAQDTLLTSLIISIP